MFTEGEAGREYLLLKRIEEHGGFWQSITGSLEPGETHVDAAIREVREESGYQITMDDLIDLSLINTFEISPRWREKYEAGITHNEEVCFAARVERREITLDAAEHDAYQWLTYDAAVELLFWESNRRALLVVREAKAGRRQDQVRE